MNEQNCIIRIKTLGPVHIGSGEILEKKEYLYNKKKKVFEILNQRKFLKLLVQENVMEKYEEFMLNQNYRDLDSFIDRNGLREKYSSCVKYKLDGSQLVYSKKNPLSQLTTCIKDPYHLPYIPGSSLKGVLIHNLLFATALENQKELNKKYYTKLLNNSNKNRGKKEKEIVADLAKRLGIRKGKIGDYISVGDSRPGCTEDLVLVQKLDVFPGNEKSENNRNVVRESIKANSEFQFPLKIKDRHILSIDKLRESIQETFFFIDNIIRIEVGYGEMEGTHLYIGGGVGFISKTLIYGLLEDGKSQKISSEILRERSPKIDRRQDLELNLVPKTIKEGISPQGHEEIGICKIDIEEL